MSKIQFHGLYVLDGRAAERPPTGTTLLVLRHAATEWIEQGRLEGRSDRPLSAAGRVGALSWRLPRGSRTLRWKVSPTRRAMETAHQIGVSAQPEPRLLEMDWGGWEGRTLAELRAIGAFTPEMEGLGLDLRPPGGETPREVQKRLSAWLTEIARTRLPTGAITHSGVLRALYGLATGWDMITKAPTKLIAARAHRFAIAENGTPTLLDANIPLRVDG